jgi:hypothetical protein
MIGHLKGYARTEVRSTAHVIKSLASVWGVLCDADILCSQAVRLLLRVTIYRWATGNKRQIILRKLPNMLPRYNGKEVPL